MFNRPKAIISPASLGERNKRVQPSKSYPPAPLLLLLLLLLSEITRPPIFRCQT